MSSILWVTTKPPEILIADTRTDAAARAYGTVCGITPPPMSKSPPTAVIPEMAFVIDIRGV